MTARYSYTQPCCRGCFIHFFGEWVGGPPTLKPELLIEEICVYCGLSNKSGIYIRVNPNLPGLHPTRTK